jgi:hypothetical protein
MARKPKPVRLSLAQLDELLYLDEQALRRAVERLRAQALFTQIVLADDAGNTPAWNKERRAAITSDSDGVQADDGEA